MYYEFGAYKIYVFDLLEVTKSPQQQDGRYTISYVGGVVMLMHRKAIPLG